jgi:hypothetical protein
MLKVIFVRHGKATAEPQALIQNGSAEPHPLSFVR